MKSIRLILVLALLVQLCACAPAPGVVYSHDEPDLNTPEDDPLPGLAEGNDARVTLHNGERFEAKYRGIHDDVLEFEDVQWEEPSDRPDEARMTCALDQVAEIRGHDWTTADTVVAIASVAGLVTMLAVYGRGDGAE